MNFTLNINCTKEDLVDIFNILIELDILDFNIDKDENITETRDTNLHKSILKHSFYVIKVSTRDIELLVELSTALSNKL